MGNRENSLIHPFAPVCDEASHVLVLGTFPSVKSRQNGFYYGHPQNMFWRVLAAIYGEALPTSIGEKRALLLKHNIALWDVLQSCEIKGSSDASIKNAVPNDIPALLRKTGITCVLANGKTAHVLYMKHVYPATHIEAGLLPSTSPANAAFTLDRLVAAWRGALLPEDE